MISLKILQRKALIKLLLIIVSIIPILIGIGRCHNASCLMHFYQQIGLALLGVLIAVLGRFHVVVLLCGLLLEFSKFEVEFLLVFNCWTHDFSFLIGI